MRIFVLLPRIPFPLEKGDKLRAFHQIKELSKNHEIILCALNPLRNADKQSAFQQLQPYCRSINFIDLPAFGRAANILKAFFTGLPLQSGYFYSRQAAGKIVKLINEYQPDHLYAQLLRTARYLMAFPHKKTLDYQDAFSYGLKRRADIANPLMKFVFRMEYKRMASFERIMFDRFDNKTIISARDRDLIPHTQRRSIVVVRNGVDLDFFHPFSRKKTQEIVFTGNMGYPPNVDAALFLAKEIMPLVWRERPEARLLLAGAEPHAKVKRLANKRITVSGWMDDIREAYAGSMVFIAPMRIGTGLQNKLLEAMAMKTPCVTTPLANASIQAKDKKEIFIGNSAVTLANALLFLLKNTQKRRQLAENAFAFVKKNHHWSAATAPLEKLISENNIQ